MTAPVPNPISPARAYGRVLGALQQGIRQFFTELSAGMEDALNPYRHLSAEEKLELLRERAHRARIEQERRKGIAHVAAEASRVRRELGLPPAGHR